MNSVASHCHSRARGHASGEPGEVRRRESQGHDDKHQPVHAEGDDVQDLPGCPAARLAAPRTEA